MPVGKLKVTPGMAALVRSGGGVARDEGLEEAARYDEVELVDQVVGEQVCHDTADGVLDAVEDANGLRYGENPARSCGSGRTAVCRSDRHCPGTQALLDDFAGRVLDLLRWGLQCLFVPQLHVNADLAVAWDHHVGGQLPVLAEDVTGLDVAEVRVAEQGGAVRLLTKRRIDCVNRADEVRLVGTAGAADIIYALATDESVFLRLTRECGRTPADYVDLITRSLNATLGTARRS